MKDYSYKLVAFDMDGTLIHTVSSWYKLHCHFGTQNLNSKNLQDFTERKIEYQEFMRRDIALWDPAPHIDAIAGALSDFEFYPNAKEVVQTLRDEGILTAIISGGIDVLANQVGEQLGVDTVLANGMETDENGYLTGKGICRVDIRKKDAVLCALAKENGFLSRECVAVGDSKWDANFLAAAGLGVAYRPDEELARVADRTILDLKELLGIVIV